jgi:hypothetical protein
MSFRRDKEKLLKWQKWLRKHHDELVACGIPHVVLDEMSHWYYFLDHGYFTPPGSAEPIINVDRMSKADAERLCLFLERDAFYGSCDTLNRLQYLLKRGRHAETSV